MLQPGFSSHMFGVPAPFSWGSAAAVWNFHQTSFKTVPPSPKVHTFAGKPVPFQRKRKVLGSISEKKQEQSHQEEPSCLFWDSKQLVSEDAETSVHVMRDSKKKKDMWDTDRC